MSNPKQLFETLAESTWERLRLSWEYGISQGEETITDLLQLEIARLGGSNIHVLKTTKAFEAQSGVDWEWWIGDNASGWLRFAIQAKKIGANGRYNALKHHVKLPGRKKLLQQTVLKRYAKEKGAIPLYCLFNHVGPGGYDEHKHWHCKAPFEPAQLGCTLAPLERIDEALRKRGGRTFDFIHRDQHAIPWRCLFCTKCSALPMLLVSSVYRMGGFPKRYHSLPPALARAKERDDVLQSEGTFDEPENIPDAERADLQAEYMNINFPILPRRIILIETNLLEISNEIADLTR